MEIQDNVDMVESAETFGKYRLLEKVAVGGMAEIYRAKTVGMGGFEKLLAIKRIHPQFGEEDEIAQMLVDEARIAVHLTHPNIAQIFDLGCIDGHYFIAMEFIDGVDLHQIHRTLADQGGSIPVAPLVFIVAEALGGLHYAHTRTDPDGKPLQIVHRDVSPQNIMISHEGEVKLVDFGIAKAEMRAQQETQHGIIKGKFYYMSPEQAHAHHVDARTDVFAAGMVLYEMLAGENPYGGIEEYQLLKAVRKADFPPVSAVRPDLDAQLAQIVTRATRRGADYRFQSARQMQLALMEYLDHHSGPYRRMELAEFIRSFHATDEPDSDGPIMSRVDYAASEASMIFEPGTPITRDGAGNVPADEPNPFAEDEPTQLWSGRDEGPGGGGLDSQEDIPAPSDLSSPQFLDIQNLEQSATEPKTPTARRKLAWLERIPSQLSQPRALFAAMALAVLVLLGILAVLVLGGEESSTDQADDEQAMQFAVDETDSVEPADTVDEPDAEQGEPTGPPDDAVVLKIATYPPDAQVSVDGERIGRSPVDAAGLSRDEEHKVVAKLGDGRTVSGSVRWRPEDGRVKQLELNFDEASTSDEAEPPKTAQKETAEKTTAKKKTTSKKRSPKRRTRRRGSSSSSAKSAKRSSSSSSRSADLLGSQEKSGSSDSEGLSVWGSGGEERVDASKGYLDVRIRGEGKVYVDGELVSGETTRVKHPVSPGSYQVRVYYSRLKRHSATKTVRVSGGESSRVFFAP
jgi:eukaryotic-like serine/threonine-protein kinase